MTALSKQHLRVLRHIAAAKGLISGLELTLRLRRETYEAHRSGPRPWLAWLAAVGDRGALMLWPSLDLLEGQGLITVACAQPWATEENPLRRVYRLSERGKLFFTESGAGLPARNLRGA